MTVKEVAKAATPTRNEIWEPKRDNRTPSVADRIDASGDCWEWTGFIDSGGYGSSIAYDGRQQRPHRVVWQMLVGPIPDGMDLDHLCRVRHCVNPDHLEPVTRSENLRRGYGGQGTLGRRFEYCRNGSGPHRMTKDNLQWDQGHRRCRTCRNDYKRSRR